ncbi:MAG TPA: hypothetical protein VEL69_06655 [Ktedonobacteraceae bacterium]|nr:hypothetical protein [Ktedonobacteraceae bacterium]
MPVDIREEDKGWERVAGEDKSPDGPPDCGLNFDRSPDCCELFFCMEGEAAYPRGPD